MLRNQGTTPGGDKYLHEQPGWNSRLDVEEVRHADDHDVGIRVRNNFV